MGADVGSRLAPQELSMWQAYLPRRNWMGLPLQWCGLVYADAVPVEQV